MFTEAKPLFREMRRDQRTGQQTESANFNLVATLGEHLTLPTGVATARSSSAA
jgi:hypothetical protein